MASEACATWDCTELVAPGSHHCRECQAAPRISKRPTIREEEAELPRRGDEDAREHTDAPVFLVQLRRFQPLELSSLDWDADDECMRLNDGSDEDGQEITEQEAVERELAEWRWDTQAVWFTRAEAQAWADERAYRGPWRVWSVPAKGELRKIVRALTDKEASDAAE